VIWSDAPAITGDLGPQQGGGGAGGHRHHPAFSIDLGSVRDCENGMLGQARTAVAGYMHLKETVRSAIDGNSVWGQQALKRVSHPAIGGPHGVAVPRRPDTFEPDDGVRQAGEAYAKAMNPAMSQVLRQCADAIEAVGQFMAMINRSAQQYAHADRQSFFPDPPPPAVKS
jgi:hypothetical protein